MNHKIFEKFSKKYVHFKTVWYNIIIPKVRDKITKR
nr:MAG TPA: hypothetical protein [Caudoviricetes sp.]